MTESIRIKVRKLLALAADAGASDNEKAIAMRKAQALIEDHNIELGTLGGSESIEVGKGDIFGKGMHRPYHHVIAAQVAELYECRHVYWARGKHGHAFWGMSHQVEAAEETFLWIVAQVEDLYRVALKAFDGRLDRAGRAELRASFKDACAVKVAQRIRAIILERSGARDSRALVVVSTAKEKVDDMIRNNGVKARGLPALREGFGTGAGFNAGDQVRIQREVRK